MPGAESERATWPGEGEGSTSKSRPWQEERYRAPPTVSEALVPGSGPPRPDPGTRGLWVLTSVEPVDKGSSSERIQLALICRRIARKPLSQTNVWASVGPCNPRRRRSVRVRLQPATTTGPVVFVYLYCGATRAPVHVGPGREPPCPLIGPGCVMSIMSLWLRAPGGKPSRSQGECVESRNVVRVSA